SAIGQKKLWVRLGIVLGIWTALAVFLTCQTYLLVASALRAQGDLPRTPPSLSMGEVFQSSLAECLIWALLTFGILWLARRFPFGQGRGLRSLAVHGVACLVCGLLAALLSALAAEVIRKEFPRPTITLNVLILFFLAKLNNNIFFYWAI